MNILQVLLALLFVSWLLSQERGQRFCLWISRECTFSVIKG